MKAALLLTWCLKKYPPAEEYLQRRRDAAVNGVLRVSSAIFGASYFCLRTGPVRVLGGGQ